MSLNSTLLGFKGDPKLESCLVNDSAHVKQGSSGAHAAKIQQASIRLDLVKIDSRELSSNTYGPSTAAAVLQYKRKRSIINFNYQTQPDDITGKMTIKSLDDELSRRFPFQPIDPSEITIPPDIPVPASPRRGSTRPR